ncbi:MAG: transporter [bacterium]|nr:transporter [bacterium]
MHIHPKRAATLLVMIVTALLTPMADLQAEDAPTWLSLNPAKDLAPTGHEHHSTACDTHKNHDHFAYAPIGVMGGHTHGKGDLMLSYRRSFMQMQGNRNGSSRMNSSEVLQNFMVAPTKMSMEMDMFGIMYGLTDDITLMTMLPYTRMSMTHRNRMGARFSTNSEGLGDISVTGIWRIKRWLSGPIKQELHVDGGVSFPTGSINQKDDTPAGPDRKLPYPMQLGSGTYDLLPALTYTGQCNRWSWGAQARATVRLGDNANSYTLGDRLMGTIWVGRKFTDWLSASVRLEGQTWGDIDGADPDLMPTMVPTADPSRRGGTRTDVFFGLSVEGQEGLLRGHRLSVEFRLPVQQHLDGPQLEVDWGLVFGWQFSF